MQLSDGVLLGACPGKAKRRWGQIKTDSGSDKVLADEFLLRTAISSVVTNAKAPSALQLEYLKGTLAQVNLMSAYGKSLVGLAEELHNTATNGDWVDRELMYEFFLHQAGFGARASRRCAGTCVDRDIPSPQRLAMIPNLSQRPADSLNWLELTSVEVTLLLAALRPFIEQQRVVASNPTGDRLVWVEVDTPPVVAERAQQSCSCSAPPPPTPSTPLDGLMVSSLSGASVGLENSDPVPSQLPLDHAPVAANSADSTSKEVVEPVPAPRNESLFYPEPMEDRLDCSIQITDSYDVQDVMELSCVTAAERTPAPAPETASPELGYELVAAHSGLWPRSLIHAQLVLVREPLRIAEMEA